METLDEQSLNTDEQLTTQALKNLKGAGPWMIFISIVNFIIIGFMILGSLGGLVASPALGGLGLAVFLLYLVMALIVFFPTLFLLQYALQISKYANLRMPHVLEKAFAKQKAFWIFCGVCLIIYIALGILMFLFVVISGTEFLEGFQDAFN